MTIWVSIILISPYGSNDLPHSHRSFVCTTIQGYILFWLDECAWRIGNPNQNKEIDNIHKCQQVYKTLKNYRKLGKIVFIAHGSHGYYTDGIGFRVRLKKENRPLRKGVSDFGIWHFGGNGDKVAVMHAARE